MMVRGDLLIGAALLLALPLTGKAQEALPPPGPTHYTTLPHPQSVDDATLTAPCGCQSSPEVPACACHEDCNGSLLKGDPLLDRPDCPAPGFFADYEVGILKPHVKFGLVGPVNVTNLFTDNVQLPFAPLDWTGSSRVELGYRFPQAFGELVVSYRSLVAQGCATISQLDSFGPGDLVSRLDLNSVDLDYSQREYGLGPDWDMKWRIGVRLASIYIDSFAVGAVEEQKASNHFLGAGPHAALDLYRTLGWGGLSLYGRLEGAAMLGRIGQGFEETFTFRNAAFGGASRASMTQAVPTFEVQVGLAWTPWQRLPLRMTCGYEYEAWYYVGRTDLSRAELQTQGAFLRGEWKY